MKTNHRVVAVLGALLAAATSPAVVEAQTPAPPFRGDVSGLIAWQNADGGPRSTFGYDNWHSSLFGAVTAGWHWTGNLKSEIDFGASAEADGYRVDYQSSDGRQVIRASRFTFARRTLGIGQQYQFFDNAWFHPHLAAGLNFTWERRTEEFEPVLRYDGNAQRPETIEPRRIEGPRTELTLRPYVAGGFKAYMTPRTFFRTDLRLAIREGLDESLLRFGFGFDF